jgi:hypothetical protein
MKEAGFLGVAILDAARLAARLFFLPTGTGVPDPIRERGTEGTGAHTDARRRPDGYSWDEKKFIFP